MVKADGTNETVTFAKPTRQNSVNNGLLHIAVANEDKAIVSFNAGDALEKYVFNKDNAQISIPQDGKDYAIACVGNEKEMPLNFKAAKNGTYTLTLDIEGMDLDYFHLIDNLTGNDIDLLHPNTVIAGEDPQIEDSTMLASQSLTPQYTFTSQITDYPCRFKLVFVCGDANDDNGDNETFAFYDGIAWVVSNTGEATLQVIDVLGRIVSSQTINGNAAINVSETAGVYVLRLVNGEKVKVQKVVVR